MEHHGKTLEILDRLVGFDTTSHRSNAPLISWVKDYLDGHGVSSTLIPDKTGQKQNLIATIGDGNLPGIVLSGHTDVVPADAARWSGDPFRMRVDQGRAYGRGTTDMKGFLSIVLAAVPDMLARRLRQPITLAFSYDEEVGCLGVPDIVSRLPTGQRVIVGEPTRLHPGTRHRGGRVQAIRLKGRPAHSGTPELGVNAIAQASAVLSRLFDLDRSLAAGGGDFPSNLVVTGIAGGGPINVVPADCEISWMLRAASAEDAAEVERALTALTAEIDAALRAQHADAGATLITFCDVPPFHSTTTSACFDRLTHGREAVNLSFATEAGFFAAQDHDVVVCGPGDMAQGHTDNEYIELEALAEGCRFIEDVIDEACS